MKYERGSVGEMPRYKNRNSDLGTVKGHTNSVVNNETENKKFALNHHRFKITGETFYRRVFCLIYFYGVVNSIRIDNI